MERVAAFEAGPDDVRAIAVQYIQPSLKFPQRATI
jgi:hypothetical protein